MRVAVAGTGVADPGAAASPGIDPAPLRRMDRYGRAGYLAGGLALLAAGRERREEADPRAGVVFGTSFGCRDSITQHATLVAGAGAVEELRPAVFVQTVFNSVNGELGIAWKLGGYSETLVSGRVAGVEALLLSAARVDEGLAELMLAGAAEGLDDAMRRAWEVERVRFGSRGVPLAERGAAMALVPAESVPRGVRVEGGASFFTPAPEEALARALDILSGLGCAPGDVLPASPDLEGALGKLGLREAPAEELFATGGLVAAIRVVEEIRAGERTRGGVLVRDPDGPTAVIVFAAPPG